MTLNEKDVWDLSPTIQSRPIFIKYGRKMSVLHPFIYCEL